MANWLDNSVKYVAGVGEVRAKLLEKELGIITIDDLLRYYPFRYVDRTKIYSIAEVNASMDTALVQVRARITGVAYSGTGRKQRFTAFASDSTGSVELTWFRGIKWVEKSVEVGREYIIFGRPSLFRNEVQFTHPELELVEQALSRADRFAMQGIYSSTEKIASTLGTKGFFKIISNAWAAAEKHITETMPQWLRDKYSLVPLKQAMHDIHFPPSAERLSAAQRRLKFDEFLGVQLSVQSLRSDRLSRRDGFLFPKVGDLFNEFFNNRLPFALTGAQKRVIKEIRQDTITGYQMNRLLQGDVGSGKTMVALMSMLLAIDNGFQACMMAPTEILARQHYATISRMTEGMNLRVAILTGSSKAAERRHALEGIASGEVNILIGTHALIEDRVQFANLGYVV
ncbi:MAG: DEAD/DEAH box helicase, partial [Alistipes sp.]|nr:DEAD/DEAH box helicase [Alistipes sp.]